MKKDIQQLLQECMEGYDAGLTPDECLSPYPSAIRAELEPLFRQAISLRVAYAASPSAEFRFQTREKLLFAAGRDVTRALSAEPDPEFVSSTRQRLLNRAGAGAQEALRDVPPPRLPFWANARRHLLEAAASAPPKPAPRLGVGLRSAVSAAVVVLAVGVAGAGFFLHDSPANQPSLAAELNEISRELDTYEQLRASGEAVSVNLLTELSIRTSRLAEQYSEASPSNDLKDKLPDLIDRQQSLLAQEDSLDESLSAAQQRLDEADQRFAVAAAETQEAEATSTPDEAVAVAPTPEATEEPTTEPTEEPSPEPTATESVTVPDVDIVNASDLEPGQIVWQYEASEEALGLRWWRVTTSALSFVMPESWSIENIEPDDEGVAMLPTSQIFIQTDIAGMMLIVSNETGEVRTAADGEVYTLREEGPDGLVMSVNDVIQLTRETDNWASLYNMLASLDLNDATPATATPSATSTATPDATLSPDEDESE